jgi:hypothetical protein
MGNEGPLNEKSELQMPPNAKVINVSPRVIERMARGAILGYTHTGAEKKRRQRLTHKVEMMVAKKGKHLIDKMFELAEGIYLVDKKSDKELRYYQVPPNYAAITYLLDRVMGKPAVNKPDGAEERRGVTAVEQIIKRLADGTITEERRTIVQSTSGQAISGRSPAGGDASDGEDNDDGGSGSESV